MEVSGYIHAQGALPPRKKNHGTHCTGGWVSPRTGLDVSDRESLSTTGIRTPHCPVCCLVAIPTALSRLLRQGKIPGTFSMKLTVAQLIKFISHGTQKSNSVFTTGCKRTSSRGLFNTAYTFAPFFNTQRLSVWV
jgi:hypothetical protein